MQSRAWKWGQELGSKPSSWCWKRSRQAAFSREAAGFVSHSQEGFGIQCPAGLLRACNCGEGRRTSASEREARGQGTDCKQMGQWGTADGKLPALHRKPHPRGRFGVILEAWRA